MFRKMNETHHAFPVSSMGFSSDGAGGLGGAEARFAVGGNGRWRSGQRRCSSAPVSGGTISVEVWPVRSKVRLLGLFALAICSRLSPCPLCQGGLH